MTNNTIILDSGIKISDLKDYFGMMFAELIAKLGNDYKIVMTGVEETYKGYYYSKLGITLVFNDYDYDINSAPLIWVECDLEKLNLNGVNEDMNFEQIQSLIGKGTIKKSRNDNSEEIYYYDLIYNVEDLEVDFCSISENAEDGFWLNIYKKYSN